MSFHSDFGKKDFDHLHEIDMNGIESLSTLLAASQEKQAFHQENKVESPSSVYANPGAIGPAKVIKSKTNGKKEKSTDIWEESEIEEMEFDQDPRITPEYQISYLQKVSSEDMFLGMSGKTPSFSHTDDIQVSITLPDANSVKDITLNITKNLLEVMTSKL
jgi:hypothetical protein